MQNKLINLNEKIFLAGSNGMAGSAIYRKLLENNYGKKEFGGKIFTPTRKELNLLNYLETEEWFAYNKPTVVIIAAAKVGGILANASKPADFLLENLKIQTNIIDIAWRQNIKRLLFLGSSCIYPKFSKQPIDESELLTGTLESTNEPYALAKIIGIKLCEKLREQYSFDAISLMPTNLYGPRDNYDLETSHVMAALIRKFCEASMHKLEKVNCWGSGRPLREFMHVDDLGNGVVFALENWDPNSSNAPKDKYGRKLTYLNLGTGKDISIKDLTTKIANLSGFKGQINWDKSKPDGTPRKLLNVDKIEGLGWKSTIKIDDGIKKTIGDYKKTYLKS